MFVCVCGCVTRCLVACDPVTRVLGQTLRNKALLTEAEGLSEELQHARSEVDRLRMQLKVDEASKSALEKEHASLMSQLAHLQ
jgi:hypothetical protein